MKKILVLLLLFFSFLAGFSQTGNDTTKYTWYKYTYGNRLQRYWADSVIDIPHDTTHSKYGLARKHDSVFVGNGISWKLISSIAPIDTNTVTPIGTGSPQIQTLWASGDGNLRTARHIPGVFTTPFQNGDSAYGVNLDTSGVGGAAYKQWIINNYGPGVGGNIYTIDGRLQGDRVVNAAGRSLTFDSLHNPIFAMGQTANRFTIVDSGADVMLQEGQSTTAGGGLKQGVQFDAVGVRSGVTYGSLIMDSGRTELIDQFSNYIIMASTSYGQPGITFNQLSGYYWFYNLLQANDTTTYKPLAADVNGRMKRMDGWAGSGGGGSTNAVGRDTVQAYASGATLTQSASTNYIQVNPASVQAALTITSLASGGTWHTSNDIYIVFGGTVTSGNPVITSFTFTAGSGMTVVQAVSPNGLTYNAGEVIHYHKIGSSLYRIN